MENIGRYRIVSELGRGAGGVVYLAEDPKIGRRVAIKTISLAATGASGDTLRKRLQREARSAGSLAHHNIVTVFELDDDGPITFVVMEFVEGSTLKHIMELNARMTPKNILALLRQVADALDFAHSRNVVHRDIKPANIMVTPEGEVKIADFGVAKMLGDGSMSMGLTQAGMAIGTPHYMSPEQVLGKPVTGQSDQFSLGVIVYELLAGKRPFEGDSLASIMYQIVNEEPQEESSATREVASSAIPILLRALAKDPLGRYPSCSKFIADLSAAIMPQAVAPPPVIEPAPLPPPPAPEVRQPGVSERVESAPAATSSAPEPRTSSSQPLGVKALQHPAPAQPPPVHVPFTPVPPAQALEDAIARPAVPVLEAVPEAGPLEQPPDIPSANRPSTTRPSNQGLRNGILIGVAAAVVLIAALIWMRSSNKPDVAATPAVQAPPPAATPKKPTAMVQPQEKTPPVTKTSDAAAATQSAATEVKPQEPDTPGIGPHSSFMWKGVLAGNDSVQISGNEPSQGTISGRLPPRRTAVRVLTIDPPDVAVSEFPSKDNDFRWSFVNEGKETSSFTVTWRLAKKGEAGNE
jgi:serine/threonine-protein kinase